jgi:mono/diheme cytochrome c family protein
MVGCMGGQRASKLTHHRTDGAQDESDHAQVEHGKPRKQQAREYLEHPCNHAVHALTCDVTIASQQGELRMMKRIVTLFALTLGLAACVTMDPPETHVAKLSGEQLYSRLCASCHGPNAQGDGAVAPFIKTGVPDLTRIALRDGGEFPTEDVTRIIDGRLEHPAHGTRDMPVWGWQLYDMSAKDPGSERALVNDMIQRLVEYLRSIQVPQS